MSLFLQDISGGLIFIIVFACLFVLAAIGLFLIAKRIRGLVFNKRYDDNHTLKYFYASDFENLEAEPIEFISKKNKIKGLIYKNTTFDSYKGVIVFAHGLGAGHVQYTTEINHFAKNGYIVVSYDISGTGNSEGKTIKGVTTGLYNLIDCLKFVENNPSLSIYKKMVIGHSLGGYAVNNVTRFNSNLVGVVSLSGFDAPYKLISEEIGLANGTEISALRFMFKLLDLFNFGKDGVLSSLDAFKKTEINHLIIAGDKDNIVDTIKNFEMFRDVLKEKNNFEFVLVNDRYHRPNITVDAANYDQETNVQLADLKRDFNNKVPEERLKKYYESLDYNLLVQLDDEVMNKIDEFIERCFQ